MFVIGLRRVKMDNHNKFYYTIPKQIPLFEEEEDGTLKQYETE